MGSGEGGHRLPMAFETEAGFQFVGQQLEVGRLLEREELLEEGHDFRRPVWPMVAARELGGEVGAFLEKAGAQPVKVGAADLELAGGLSDVDQPLVELVEDLLEKQVGETFGDLLFLIAPSQTNRCPLVEGLRRLSLRSGLLNPSTKGQFQPPHPLSPFELAAVPFCSRPDSTKFRSEILIPPGPGFPAGGALKVPMNVGAPCPK